MLLAIDTSAGTSVALAWNSGACELGSSNPMTHAEVIGDFVERVIVKSGCDRSHIEGVVAGIGPGPFTGLRVGLAAASAFAVGLGVPIFPVVSHDAAAFDALEDGPGPVIIVTDARRKELYWSVYSGSDESTGLPIRVAGPELSKPEGVLTEWSGTVLRRIDATEVSAGLLALIARRKRAAEHEFEPFEALYLRSPDVTMPSAPKRVN